MLAIALYRANRLKLEQVIANTSYSFWVLDFTVPGIVQ